MPRFAKVRSKDFPSFELRVLIEPLANLAAARVYAIPASEIDFDHVEITSSGALHRRHDRFVLTRDGVGYIPDGTDPRQMLILIGPCELTPETD